MLRAATRSANTPYLFTLICAGIAAYTAFRAWRKYTRARRTLSWRSVEGIITHSRLDERERKRRNYQDMSEYRANIEYTYRLGPETYVGRRVYFDAHGWSSSAKLADELLSRYTRGKTVRVFYDPDHPEEAVLERGQDQSARAERNYAIVFGILAVVLWLAGK